MVDADQLIRDVRMRDKRRRIVLTGGQPSITDYINVGKIAEPKSSTSSPIVRSFVAQPRRNLNASLNLNSSKKKTEENIDLELTSSNLARDKFLSEQSVAQFHVKRKNSGTFVSHNVIAPTPARADPLAPQNVPIPDTPSSSTANGSIPPTPVSGTASIPSSSSKA